MICSYGCGKEATHQFKNGKWCCSRSIPSCEKQKEIQKRIKNTPEFKSKQREKTIQYLNNESEESKNNRIKKMKKGMLLNNAGRKISEKLIKRLENQDYRKNLSIKAIERFKNQNERNKLSICFKHTIEKIKNKYPFFLEIEELRYNPENPQDKEIQARCKNPNCKNSKEKDGWFSPTGQQITNRIFVSKKRYGRSFFFCSEKCKEESDLFNFRVDPETYKKYKRYQNIVIRITNKSLKNHYNDIKNIELRGLKYGYDLDHKYSVFDGFINNIDPKIVGHYKNLEIIESKKNRNIKGKTSSVDLNTLIKEIEEWDQKS